jgi:hypothetical protein
MNRPYFNSTEQKVKKTALYQGGSEIFSFFSPSPFHVENPAIGGKEGEMSAR